MELKTSNIRSSKTEKIGFILSCVSAANLINMYVIDGTDTNCCFCIKRGTTEWNY